MMLSLGAVLQTSELSNLLLSPMSCSSVIQPASAAYRTTSAALGNDKIARGASGSRWEKNSFVTRLNWVSSFLSPRKFWTRYW